ncbi:helix-turn-helix transcriptional regulator [Nonomuraea sp. NPDC059007]|uniref:helix-turn-helix transcriptional regulator n=1 Tax=Nonomuraea sp. NPDC059007 TaxID=3346692 RepID=UPI00367DECE3
MGNNELGAFLRARREAVPPEAVGFPSGTRRRTPGLRRAELATVAGVSVDYLTRLEQGRDRRPSTEILTALADALSLSPDERIHLHRLHKADAGGVCAGAPPLSRTLRPTVEAMLARLAHTPAVVVNQLTEILAHTPAYARLLGPFGLLDDDPPNLARYLFTDPRARDAFPGWTEVAAEHAADLRASAALGDQHAAHLAGELSLTAGATFTRPYANVMLPARIGTERWAHPEGELLLAYETLTLAGTDDQRLIVYVPADEATTTLLAEPTRTSLS